MSKKSICIFGVNGVGKSSLIRLVSEELQDVIVYRGSVLLKETLGVASYEGLEALNPERKKQALLDGIRLVTQHTDGIVIVDTHLVVPIRKGRMLLAEDMWDDQMLSLFGGFVYVCATPEIVSCRRKIDDERTIRTLNSSPQSCAEDLHLNAKKWDEISSKMSNRKVIINDQTMDVGAGKIISFVSTLS